MPRAKKNHVHVLAAGIRIEYQVLQDGLIAGLLIIEQPNLTPEAVHVHLMTSNAQIVSVQVQRFGGERGPLLAPFALQRGDIALDVVIGRVGNGLTYTALYRTLLRQATTEGQQQRQSRDEEKQGDE